MAANSGGVEWASIIKPILSASYGFINKHELLELCSAINKSESEIVHHKEKFKVFYNSFAILAADYISTNANSLSNNHMDVVCNACRVLLSYLINALQSLTAEPVPNTVQANRLLNAIKSLCLGTGLLSKTDQASLTTTMKSENLPPHIKTNLSGNEKESTPKTESANPRSDLSSSIYEKLTLPLREGQISLPQESELIKLVGSESAEGTSDASSEIKRLCFSTNVESLQGLRASDILLDLCLNLSSVKRSKTKCDEAVDGKTFSLPTTYSEATAIRNSLPSMVADISVAFSAVSLPILEPLNPTKLEKLHALCMASLHCAVLQASACSILGMGSAVSPKCSSTQTTGITSVSNKEDDYDSLAVTLIEKVLHMFTYIGDTIKNSTRAGGHFYQNLILAGAWVLLSGLQIQLSISTAPSTDKEKGTHLKERDDKGRSPSKSRDSNSSRVSLMKVQQGFGVLLVALSTRALQLTSELLDDLHLEICGGSVPPIQVQPAPLTIMAQCTALQRAVRLLVTVPLNQLLFYLATISYRKACTLKRIQKHPPEGDTFSQSDSTTYYEDMIMCSDESSTDEDDDSEPILGQWFEETLAPPETTEPSAVVSNNDNQESKPTTTEPGQSLVPEKGEPHGYITLATQIFTFMNKHLLTTKCGFVMRYVKAGLTEQQMIILAAIIRDLDKETARTETGTISVYFGSILGQLYSDFSGALTRYTHNLVTHSALGSLHASLLNHLGISPWNVDIPHAWPLQVYPRTLAVLAQVLLLRPQLEKEASIISIWRRLVNTLVENVVNPATVVKDIDSESDDLNVEHAQVLLYLFHSLNLMQKKSVLLLTAGGVVRGSEVARGSLKDSQILHLSRLLLLLDYIMKHLYDAPPALLEQIHWNLFSSTNLTCDKDNKESNVSRMYTSWLDIEDNYRKHGGADEFAMKPRFYAITNMGINNQDVPKLDGLACNFILGTPDKLRYPLLLDALIEILNVTHVTSGPNSSKLTYLGLCATQYCFTICWRLLLMIPPSTPYMDRLSSGENIPAGLLLLHTLVWGPRAHTKTFNRWLKDCLVKQGMYTQYTEKLLKAVSDSVNTLKYDISVARNCVIALTPDVKLGAPVRKEELPPLWHIFLLDSVMAKVQVSLMDETETTSADSGVSSTTLVQEFLPHVVRLAQAVLHCCCWSLMYTITEQHETTGKTTSLDSELQLLQNHLAVCCSHNTLTSTFVPELIGYLPTHVISVIENWNSSFLEDCSLTPFLNDIITAESYILSMVNAHVSTLSMNSVFRVNLSLKQLLQDLVKFVCQHIPKTDDAELKNKALQLLIILSLDGRAEYLYETVQKTLDKMIGTSDSDERQKRVDTVVLEHTYKLIVNYKVSNTESSFNIDEKVLHCCLKYWEKILEKPAGRQALETFFKGDGDLIKVLMSVSGQQMSQQYSTRVLHFFNKLFKATEKNPTDSSLNYLCSSISRLADVDDDNLQVWLKHIILGSSNVMTSSGSSNVPTTVVTNSKVPPVEETVKSEGEGSGTNNQWAVSQTVSSESNVSPSPSEEQKTLLQENSQLLQALTTYIVKQNSTICEDVAITILKALIPMGSTLLSPPIEGIGFSDLIVVMAMLADAGSGKGHTHLLSAVCEWLDTCKQYLTQKDILDKIKEGTFSGKHSAMLDATCHLLNYIDDITEALSPQSSGASSVPGSLVRALSPPWEGEIPPELDTEWTDDVNDEEDSAAEDSDEDSLCNKLCTFTITQKEFMNQHWYHCHTCNMLDGVGVCSVCARVCHRGHDLSYAKYGNFFCDCGAKEDGSCQALVKRSPQTSTEPQPSTSTTQSSNTNYGVEPMLTSSLRRRPSSPIVVDKANLYRDKKKGSSIIKHIEASREWLTNHIASSSMIANMLELLNSVVPIVEISCQKNSPVGCQARAQDALHKLHIAEKKCIHTDQLMVPTLGSQEGAFENVRMSYAGEQGQTIRQLLSAHIVRRVAMCCMTSPHGKRQHLAVSHEKGKITVLQLSALLKQADSAKRKLTLTRLASAPIPFTVLTLSGNPCNEDFLAVCGLKDCHVLTFSSTGAVVDHLVLHPQLETGNFIIRAIWLPGSQTELALITADFVKIYNLSKDALSPQYFFLVPSGKIRDCTFMYEDGVYHILLMSSPGHIYTETLNEESSAKHGSFYVTNTLEVFHLDVTDVNGQVAGGGVSIYYSHTLRLLFFSYAQGKSFIAPLTSKSNCLTTVYQISLSSTNSSSSSSSKSNGSKATTPQPLCQWTEIANHPGLICSVMQTSNNPVILMLKPDSIMVQEIKVVPAKAKIMDMVAIRHTSGSELRTTLILLCEDGSLRIYMANMEQTGTWMLLSMQPISNPVAVKPVRKKKAVKQNKSSNSVSFPVDFFEHCQPMNDVEFGGNDCLQVYNHGQFKNRLNTTGMYIVCTKPLGFSVEITNSDNNMVMTGIRVLLGSQEIQRAPSYIEVFGRVIATTLTRNRWYDIPFTREESLQSDKKLTISFGPSQDPFIVTMVDSIKVYGKTKDIFGWPEETEEPVNSNSIAIPNSNNIALEQDSVNNCPTVLTSFDRLVSNLLEVLENSFSLFPPGGDEKLTSHKPTAMEVASKLLCLPTAASIQMHTKALLAALHPTRHQYHSYKDHALLTHVLDSLTQMRKIQDQPPEIDAENFFRLVLIVRGIAVSRPQNLVKFADTYTKEQGIQLDDPLSDLKPNKELAYQPNRHLIYQLIEVMWLLHSLNPHKPVLAPVVVPGLKHTEQLIHAVVEIVHAFNTCDTSNTILGIYLQLLLSQDQLIAFSARQAICRVLKPRGKRRRVFIPSPPHCTTPPEKTSAESEEEKPSTSTHTGQEEERRENEQRFDVDSVETIAFLQQDGQAAGGQQMHLNPLEALLGGGVPFPQLLDIPPDADDETMVELAIALSLQEHELGGELRELHQQGAVIAGQALQSLQQVLANQGLVQPVGVTQAQEIGAGHYSDTTASATGSDDEGSTAATDGSTLRTSPADQGGSAGGSESGGSGADSITGEQNASGRSSSYGDNMQEAISIVSKTEATTAAVSTTPQVTDTTVHESEMEIESELENANKLHTLRLQLLEKLILYIPNLKQVCGVRVIPFMQVILVLTTDLDGTVEKDCNCLELLLKTVINELKMSNPDTNDICARTKEREVHFIIMRLLSVLLSRWKPSSGNKTNIVDNSAFIAQTTAVFLNNAKIINFCLKLLQALLDYWRSVSTEENAPPIGGVLLKEHMNYPPPDMQPFFIKQYVKGHSTDVFEMYPQLLTEIILRLPYQVHKNTGTLQTVSQVFDQSWYRLLCEYMMTSQAPFVRRQVRKLLLFVCGNKEIYRQLRDLHALETHVQAIQEACKKGGYDTSGAQYAISLPYDSLVELMEHLKACLEIASGRTGNWQKFCLQYNTPLSFLIQISYLLDEGVSSTVLQLLQFAICSSDTNSGGTKKSESLAKSASVTVARKDRERSEESELESKFDEANSVALVHQLTKQILPEVLKSFIKSFLLETNSTNVRWQAHGLTFAIYKHSKQPQQEQLLKLMWNLWQYLPAYGRKAAQFVDLLGYFSLRFSNSQENVNIINQYVEQAVVVLKSQNELLAHHPNANLYANIAQFVELEGYYLESEPCLVCNNPEVPLTTIKLSAIKVDSKFTTTTQIVKLVGSHTISKITLRIGDLKRTKMVRTINFYYNNRSVQAVVELKNKPALWHKAKKVTLQSGQTEVKIDFPLAIIACNLMIEYADFYENIQASSETLQCPRCSAAVPANPGVCANCGENVFQCHKCRAINYDEKDPFLCHACGFCKYAKFDYTLIARPCCAVETIETDDDRKKMVANINTLLEKADRVYKQLMGNKPSLEASLLKISEHRMERKNEEGTSSNVSSGVQVNKTIQILAQQYCTECKTSFEELSKIIQKVLVSRKELVAYDRKQSDLGPMTSSYVDNRPNASSDMPLNYPTTGRCFGCASAATEHCLTLLRALANNVSTRILLCNQGLIQELVWNNLRKGTVQEEVRQLLCILTRDNHNATESLCNLLMDRIAPSLYGLQNADLGTGVRHEIALLASLVKIEDECWELKIRCLIHLFLTACNDSKNPLVMDSIILPCLKIFRGLVKPPPPNKKQIEKTVSTPVNIKEPHGLIVNVYKWLEGDRRHSFSRFLKWQSSLTETNQVLPKNKDELHVYYIQEKYWKRWRNAMNIKHKIHEFDFKLCNLSWLKVVVFNGSSRLARQVACSIVESMCNTYERKKEMLKLLTSYLDEVSRAGESSTEFLAMYQNLIEEAPWKEYLAIRGVLTKLAKLLTYEIQELHRLEETTLTSDLAQGYALIQLTNILQNFLDNDTIRRQYKGRLVADVLNGYLSLKRLVVQRTRLVDDTQEKLLELLEEMTTGTEEETKAFMAVCIETVEKFSIQDVLTPVFIFERLCSIIYPEENDIGEFFLTLEKDPQQEDFLQGRMLGNPYSSLEAGLGPLMRNVKNKICLDCELVALLEDDNGMELLVNNKIISLDLPVKEVYKKVWLAEGSEGDSMRVVYRMRGLLGDATEEFIETLNAKSQETVNNEEVYKMANVLADCGGLKVMLSRLAAIKNISRAKSLLQVLLKLFRLCVKVQKNRAVLSQPELRSIEVFLSVLCICLESESDGNQAVITEQLLDIMETILSNATSQTLDSFINFSQTFGGPEYIHSLLTCSTKSNVRNNQSVQVHLTRVLAALVYGNQEKMEILLNYFKPVLSFNTFDFEHTPEDEHKMELFCVLTTGIERNSIGNTLKDYIISLDIVREALEYIVMHAPCVKPTLLKTDSDELKEFISKPALKYILRFLTGLAQEHEKAQVTVAEDIIPIIHCLEQVSSDEHVGSLAENLLEALKTNEKVATNIEQVRAFTRSEKKRLAMAMREKQLAGLNMRTNDKGQVTAKSVILQQMEELGEESGLICCICREGYKYQPTKVLGIYTFTKRCNVEEFEVKSRKTVGYNTVTHFNVVHVDCHMSAVRLARARDEWESAALQNANTKCNGLLPLWGPQVPESAFASCLARHNTYLQESTGHRDIGHQSTVHDLKLLIFRFALEKSFHDDTGGGGPQSNLHMIPYLIHMGLYVINTTRSASKEDKNLSTYLEFSSTEKWVESSYESEGPLYWATMSVLLHSYQRWQNNMLSHLRRLIVLAHTRHCSPVTPCKTVEDKEAKDYSVYKPYLVFFGIINGIYNCFFKNISGSDEQWPNNLADYIRHNDEAMLKASERLLNIYTEELLPSASFVEFCDVTGLLNVISNPDVYISNILRSI